MIPLICIYTQALSDPLKFISINRNTALQAADRNPGKTLIDHKPSYVALSESENYIIKLIKPRKWHDRVKQFWFHSRLHKEVEGNLHLKGLGFRVPEVMEMGTALPIGQSRHFLGYYIMENLKNSGYIDAIDLFENNAHKRQAILASIISELKKMRDNHIVFSDFHLSNVMIDSAGTLAWIDTGITHYQWYRRYKFKKKFNHAINRLISYYSSDYFLEHEKEEISKLLIR